MCSYVVFLGLCLYFVFLGWLMCIMCSQFKGTTVPCVEFICISSTLASISLCKWYVWFGCVGSRELCGTQFTFSVWTEIEKPRVNHLLLTRTTTPRDEQHLNAECCLLFHSLNAFFLCLTKKTVKREGERCSSHSYT